MGAKGRDLDFWISSNPERPTMLLRAIRAVWGKEKSQMEVQYDYEKSCGDTYYIPVTLFTCMKEQFPLLMWAEMFQTSPQFAICHGPPEIMVAIESCLRGDQDPWKDTRVAIGDGPRMLSITNQPDRVKKSTKRPKSDTRSEVTGWSTRPTRQDWSTSGGQWTGWVDYSSFQIGLARRFHAHRSIGSRCIHRTTRRSIRIRLKHRRSGRRQLFQEAIRHIQ